LEEKRIARWDRSFLRFPPPTDCQFAPWKDDRRHSPNPDGIFVNKFGTRSIGPDLFQARGFRFLHFCIWQIVLKKSFWGDERKFLGPLMPFARGDVRDHVVSHKSDQGASYGRYTVLQWRSRLKISFCEIFGVVRFSTFATLSAQTGRGAMSDLSPLSGVKRKLDFGAVRSVDDPRGR
jgi:hypothetical protein